MQLVVYAQYYRCKSADRQREIDECLRRNLNHPGIGKVVLFKEADAPPLPQATVPVEVVESDERITYAEWLRWVKRQGSGIGLLLNAVIYLDEGLEHLAATFDSPDAFLALTRYNPGHAGFHLNDYPHWTQDVLGRARYQQTTKNTHIASPSLIAMTSTDPDRRLIGLPKLNTQHEPH